MSNDKDNGNKSKVEMELLTAANSLELIFPEFVILNTSSDGREHCGLLLYIVN